MKMATMLLLLKLRPLNLNVILFSVYPDRCTVSITASSDLDLYDKHVTYWDNVYGFKMTCMKSSVIRESSVYIVKPETIAADHCVIKVTKYRGQIKVFVKGRFLEFRRYHKFFF